MRRLPAMAPELRRQWVLGLGALALLTGCTSPAPQAAPDDSRAVAAAVDQLTRLMLKPDAAGLGLLLHDRLSYGHSGGKVDSKASLTQALVSGSSAFGRIDLSAQTVSVVGDVASVRHVFDADNRPAGKPPTKVHLQVLSVWLRGSSGWQLLARQAVTLS